MTVFQVSSFLRCSLVDESKGTLKANKRNQRLVEFDYPCSNNSDCSPYKLKLRSSTYKIELMGAQGGTSNRAPNGYGGKGGYAAGTITFDADVTLYLYTGGEGSLYNQNNVELLGGWNGGGSNVKNSAPGGGGTDIRLVAGDDRESLVSRIMVAGGGGGCNDGFYGGAGGGLVGEVSENGLYNQFGTQTAGGASSRVPGIFGSGGGSPLDGGGGGGGYYGGGQGTSTTAGGGGGSGFISGYPGCDAVDTEGNPTGQPIHMSDFEFTDGSFVTGYQEGHGAARIYLIDGYTENSGKLHKISFVKLMFSLLLQQ